MPQLNPSPWFLIMLLVWAALMIIFLNKTLMMLSPNTPTETASETKHMTSWTWPWH
uniref:ATP synthase complex subunit 8 n=1 Tax=Sceloporus occidentalis TaxID=8519 RepID=Q6I7Z8_SCEOC|nr:ATP synthase F0 subunit 8 [Sceloporus occidentalis]BAD24728.1 ATPase subunit 8 [Sceloporus occidentalis]